MWSKKIGLKQCDQKLSSKQLDPKHVQKIWSNWLNPKNFIKKSWPKQFDPNTSFQTILSKKSYLSSLVQLLRSYWFYPNEISWYHGAKSPLFMFYQF
jgi:hypothetical protein